MVADECNTMSATLRFPFRASLDGTSLVETNGNFYYGHDTGRAYAELQAEAEPGPESVTEAERSQQTEEKTESEAATMADSEEEQQQDMQKPPVIYHTPRWESLLNDVEPNVTTSRPASMMPHLIDTSDQQRFATVHEMSAEQTEEGEEDDKLYCESPTSTIEPPAPPKQQSLARKGAPPRFYSTPIVEGDPNSTPVLLYGLEQPSEHTVRHKKLVSALRSRNYYSAAPARPSSRYGPSPLSSAVQPRIPEEPEPSESSSRRISMMFSGRASQSTYIPSKADRPAVDSTSSSTNSTIRSMATTIATDNESTTPASSTSASPTLEATPPADEKPSPSLNGADTTTDHIREDNQPVVASPPSPSLPPSPPRPIRHLTTPAMGYISDNVSVSGESSRRMSIFNFRFRKPSTPMTQHSFMHSNETVGTIRAAEGDAQEASTLPLSFPLPPAAPTESESPSKPMPYSPDSFISPHTQPSRSRSESRTTPLPDDSTTNNDNNNNNDNNSITSPKIIRPHTSYNLATASSSSTQTNTTSQSSASPGFSTTPRDVRNFSKPRNFGPTTPQLQPSEPGHSGNTGKGKRNAAHRATKFLTRVFITD